MDHVEIARAAKIARHGPVKIVDRVAKNVRHGAANRAREIFAILVTWSCAPCRDGVGAGYF